MQRTFICVDRENTKTTDSFSHSLFRFKMTRKLAYPAFCKSIRCLFVHNQHKAKGSNGRRFISVSPQYFYPQICMLAFRCITRTACSSLARPISYYASNPSECFFLFLGAGLVSTEWVFNRLGSVKNLDTTRHITPKKNAKTEFMTVFLFFFIS